MRLWFEMFQTWYFCGLNFTDIKKIETFQTISVDFQKSMKSVKLRENELEQNAKQEQEYKDEREQLKLALKNST